MKSPHRIHIERILLDGIDLSPDQAARLRPQIETELARLLAREGLPAPAGDVRITRMTGPALHRSGAGLAAGIARQIAGTLRRAR